MLDHWFPSIDKNLLVCLYEVVLPLDFWGVRA